jgi:CheY-like chemotaxis protein
MGAHHSEPFIARLPFSRQSLFIMPRTLRLLLVEDSENDTLLLLNHLQQSGYVVDWSRVENASSLRAALDGGPWDVVLSDDSLPQFNGLEALAMVRAKAPELPFVLVSGTIDESVAAAAKEAGVDEYVMKDNLHELVPVLERLTQASRARRASARGI